MSNERSFWRSLEKYSWRVLGRSRLPYYWRHVGVGLVLIMFATSLKHAKYSVVGVENMAGVVKRAADSGDYQSAQKLWDETMPELEDKVYPERKVEREIAELEQKLEEYPGNREIFLMLGELYGELDGVRAGEPRPYGEMAAEYREKARILDPNNVEFR